MGRRARCRISWRVSREPAGGVTSLQDQRPALALDFGFARRARHQIGALKIDFCGPTAVSITDRPGGTAHYIDAIRWCWIAGVCRYLRLGLRLRRGPKRHYDCQGDACCLEHESPSKNFESQY